MANLMITPSDLFLETFGKSNIEIKLKIQKFIDEKQNDYHQLKKMKMLLETTENSTENMNEIILKTWNVFISKQLWKMDFESQQKTIKKLDFSIFKNIKKCASSHRQKKKIIIKKIKIAWKKNVLRFEILTQ